MNKISIPKGANSVILGLRYLGHEAYVVGGCVRDSLLGIEPHDWDICTSALPDEVKDYLLRRNIRTVDTGLKHGTITAVLDSGEHYEITTFRQDGNYSDNRHPDSVEFVDSVITDLSRRDFTINAIAFNTAGLVDPFHGRKDLERRTISCVGNPDDRFSEDALRILRALRFASTYQFHIEPETAESIHKNRDLLRNIAPERIQSELCKLLMGAGVTDILLEYSDVIATVIPEFLPCISFEQNNRFHQYTVYEHIVRAVGNYGGNDLSVRVALFLHDIGKPQCYTEDEKGGHFYGHAVPSTDIARAILERLRFDNRTKDEVLELIFNHDAVIEPTQRVVKKWLNKIGEERFLQLLDVRMADIKAHAEGTQTSRINRCNSLREIANTVLEQRQCFALKDLEIKGNDIISLGVPEGKVVGDVLRYVLEAVINGELPNSKEKLMCAVRQYLEVHGFEFKK